MNIIQIQNQLKGLPDNIIAGYVQNPNAQVPAYLALSELQRRKTTREEYQQQQQAPQQSVAQSLTSQIPQPQPQMQQPQQGQPQGLASLPMSGGPQPQKNFARGGIVAFDEGGEVDPEESALDAQIEQARRAEAQQAVVDAAAYKQIMAEYAERDTPIQTTQDMSSQDPTNKGIYTLDKDLPTTDITAQVVPQELTAPPAYDFENETQAARRARLGINSLKKEPPGSVKENLPTTDITAQVVPQELTAPPAYDFENETQAARSARLGINSLKKEPPGSVKENAATGDRMITQMNERKTRDSQEKTKEYKASTARDQERIKAAQAARGITTLPQTTSAPVTAAATAPLSPLDQARAAYLASIQPDTASHDEARARMKHLDEQAKWRREHTDSDAITKAGLAMMSAAARPGATFLGSAAAGGEAGLKSLEDARNIQYATEEKQFALRQNLHQAERAEKIAIAQFGVYSAEADQARQDKKDAADALAKAHLEAVKEQGKSHIRGAEIAAGASRYHTDKQVANAEVGQSGMTKAAVDATSKLYAKQAEEYDRAIKILEAKKFNKTPADVTAIENLTKLKNEVIKNQENLANQIAGRPITAAPATPAPKSTLTKDPKTGILRYGFN